MSSRRLSSHTFAGIFSINFLIIILYIVTHECNGVLQNEYLYPTEINSRIRQYVFVISEGEVQPDNYRQSGYLINGQFPGPTIFANQFDTLEVTVYNYMTVPTVIHFHGILQEHTVGSDGVSYVTQDPIMPNQTFVYQVQLGTQTGTFMYHGHIGYDSVFVKGAMIIRDNPSYWHALGQDYRFEPGYEYSFLMGEVYHYSLTQFESDVTGVWKGKPPAFSVHINGYSYGEWEENNGDAPGYQVFKVIPGKIYRFRIMNMASDSMLLFSIEGHSFRVIEMDGILTFPLWTDRVEINSGQRYSIMVNMDKDVGNYWIRSQIMNPFGGSPDNGRAILSYVGAPDPEPMRKMLFKTNTEIIKPTSWILPLLMPNRMLSQSEVYELPKKSNRRIIIDSVFVRGDDGVQRILINGHHYQDPPITYLTQVRNGIDISKNSKQVYEMIEGDVVDIVFQNRVMIPAGPCLQHPWHLHGHSFYLVAEGPDLIPDFQKLDHIIERNIANGRLQFRDVFTMFPYQKVENTSSGAGCGWAVIRLVANNPGVWVAHCHLTTHFIMGKRFVIYEYAKDNPRLMNE